MPLLIKNQQYKTNTNFYHVIGLAIVCIAVLFTSLQSFAADSKGPAPDFTLPSKNGGNVRLQEQLGNVVLINFWASWCAPCREELPYLEALQQEYADLGFTILAVNVDDDSSKADILLNDIPVSFPVLFDVNDDVSKLYQVNAMPTTVIVDRDGNQRLLHQGYKSGDEVQYKQAVKALLRE
ncbi:TlpA family protein disulfide reductase [Paraglaciecola arctica]|uniref:Thiol-disulfide isomerase and thioredoxin n=1 Tax=Paraglaciecola arctica BSs20135 TaxID=493475 RepID=K6XEU8_9ALTE|nr:TlpA disulfide reductase family protein [Paraglaciecola arctica]GAC19174.1 thiol-disulfide isomerase and thioredoxin [Paraglaciecola arctica BSs20135]